MFKGVKKHFDWLKENTGKGCIVIKDIDLKDFYGLKKN
tara:strand:- start:532 stop:645 length:114 start_codon:yes stop_codon:yes gene_type:complete